MQNNYHDGGWADCRDATAGEDVILQLCDVELPHFFHFAGADKIYRVTKRGADEVSIHVAHETLHQEICCS